MRVFPIKKKAHYANELSAFYVYIKNVLWFSDYVNLQPCFQTLRVPGTLQIGDFKINRACALEAYGNPTALSNG